MNRAGLDQQQLLPYFGTKLMSQLRCLDGQKTDNSADKSSFSRGEITSFSILGDYVSASRMSSREKTHTRLLVLWVFFLSAAECAGSHSLGFLSTGRFPPGTGPDFEQVTVFDGVLISHCDSRTPQEQFKAVLESHNLIRTCEEAQYDVSDALKEVSKFINSTLYVQRRRGCTRSAEGLTSAFEIWAVNGEDFIQFDADHQEWEALTDTALTTRDSWNDQEIRNHVFGSFLKVQCPQMIQRINLTEVEQRTDLRVFATPIDRFQTLLKCHVTSTDKSLRSLSLTEDGASRALWVAVRGPLPSVDGSVVLRLTAEVPLGYSNIYGCVGQTGGGTITVMWDGKTLDGRDILSTSFYWILFYTFFFFSLILFPLLVCATQRWCYKSRRVRRFLKLENTNENEPSKNVVELEMERLTTTDLHPNSVGGCPSPGSSLSSYLHSRPEPELSPGAH